MSKAKTSSCAERKTGPDIHRVCNLLALIAGGSSRNNIDSESLYGSYFELQDAQPSAKRASFTWFVTPRERRAAYAASAEQHQKLFFCPLGEIHYESSRRNCIIIITISDLRPPEARCIRLMACCRSRPRAIASSKNVFRVQGSLQAFERHV